MELKGRHKEKIIQMVLTASEDEWLDLLSILSKNNEMVALDFVDILKSVLSTSEDEVKLKNI